MSRIILRREHQLTQALAKAAVERAALAIEKRFSVKSAWEGNTLTFARPGVKGSIRLLEGEIEIHVALEFLLSFLKPQIEAEIKRQLDLNFG